MKTKTLITVLLVAVMSLWLPDALAQGPGGPGGPAGPGGKGGGGGDIAGMPHGRWWNNPEIKKEINLTDAQVKKMQEVMIEHRKKVMDLNNEAEKLKLDLDQVMEAKKFDAGAAESLLEKIQKYRAQAMLLRGKMLIEFREILSRDQYLKLKSLREKRRGGRGGRGKGQPGFGKRRPGRQGLGQHGQGMHRGFHEGRHKIWWQK